MANPMKAIKAVKKITTGKKKAVKKSKIVDSKVSTVQGQSGYGVFKKATSNKKLGASLRAGRGGLQSAVRNKIKEERKMGIAQNTKFFNSEIKDKGRTPGQFSPGKKRIPVKKRGN